jgi:hypothetical protein
MWEVSGNPGACQCRYAGVHAPIGTRRARPARSRNTPCALYALTRSTLSSHTGALVPRHRVLGRYQELPPVALRVEISLASACKHRARLSRASELPRPHRFHAHPVSPNLMYFFYDAKLARQEKPRDLANFCSPSSSSAQRATGHMPARRSVTALRARPVPRATRPDCTPGGEGRCRASVAALGSCFVVCRGQHARAPRARALSYCSLATAGAAGVGCGGGKNRPRCMPNGAAPARYHNRECAFCVPPLAPLETDIRPSPGKKS